MNPVAKLAIAGINMGAAALVGKGLGLACSVVSSTKTLRFPRESS